MLERASEKKAKRRRGRRQVFLPVCLGLISIPLLFFTACQRQDDVIAGVTIPIPAQMKKIPDKVFEPVPGFKEGQASYEGKMASREIFTFYQENMEARGWKPTTFMGGEKDQLTYTKDNRVCLVWYTPNADGTIGLTIMIGILKPPV